MRGARVGRGARVMAVALLAAVMTGTFPSLAAAAGSRSWPGAKTASEALASDGKAVPGAQAASSLLYAAFFGVAATSPRNAWAVGQYQSGTVLRTLIVHWNGRTWSRVPSPNPAPAGDVLNGVAATSATNAWAVGGKNGHSLILHWNGKTWREVPSPDRGAVAGVAATSAANAWAVTIGGSETAIEHWNGRAWRVVPSPVRVGNLVAVAATSASNAWAVGSSGNPSGTTHALAEHWNGKVWRVVHSPDPRRRRQPSRRGRDLGLLTAVTATSPANAWAVGSGDSGALIEHWNGTRWTGLTFS